MAKLRNETALSTKSIPIISLRVTTRYVITSFEPFIIPFLIQYLQDHCNKRLFRYRHQIMAKSQRNVIQITIVYFIFRNREQTSMRPIAHAQFCLPWIDHRYNSRYGHGGGTLANLYGRRLRTAAVFKLGSADQRGSAAGSHGVRERIPKSSNCLHGF